MKILLGIKTDVSSLGDSIFKDNITDVIKEGTTEEIFDFLNDAKDAKKNISKNQDRIMYLEQLKYDTGLNSVQEKEFNEVIKKYHFGRKMVSYDKLIIMEGETIQI
jgi:hypothetical protein